MNIQQKIKDIKPMANFFPVEHLRRYFGEHLFFVHTMKVNSHLNGLVTNMLQSIFFGFSPVGKKKVSQV